MLSSYYDKKNNRLVQVGVRADCKFWDAHWGNNPSAAFRPRSFIIPVVKKFLRQGKILEAGCGRGDKVCLLQQAGYQALGVDYAPQAVERARQLRPDLDIRVADALQLPFSDEFFDGYLSLGVIEHFYQGYEPLLREMVRVLKPGGWAFVSFPFISPLRAAKIRRGVYPLWEDPATAPDNFYQFILSPRQVISDFQGLGLEVKYIVFHDATKGIKDELELLKRPLQRIYDSPRIYMRGLKYFIDKIFSPAAGHLALVVFSKERNS
jgi:SAM-dependent methyltransferase